MECNKEEALRAMKLSEKKMEENDFVTAQKLATKAQKLYPDIENISRLLTVCEVHCSSMTKIGSEMDWYKILQIEQTADVAAIKKQYRKLAFLLHPDKNVFAGAEAAFKLIGEANRTLSDEMKRSIYDRRYRDLTRTGVQKPSRPQSNGKSSVQSHYGVPSNNLPNFSGPQNGGRYPQSQTFWTRCPFCNVRYEYHSMCFRTTLLCQGCRKYFLAEDIGTPGERPGSFQSVPNLRESRNQFPPKVPVPAKEGSSSRKRSSKASTVGPQAAEEKLNVAKSSKMGERENGDVEAKKEGVEASKPATVFPKNSNKKRARKFVAKSSDSVRDVGVKEGNIVSSSKVSESKRRSSRPKQNVSYKEKLHNDDDDFVNPPKRSRVTESATSAEEKIGRERSKGEFPSGNTAAFEEADISDQEQKSNAGDGSELNPDGASNPEIFQYPDPEFGDFDKDRAESCFAANQIWAMYDPEDGMPRFYARIKKVCFPKFKLEITWLEASPDREAEVNWCAEGLPVACGKYRLSGIDIAYHGMFSHQMCRVKGIRSTYLVYPMKGETWAIFRNWNINWSSDPDKHKQFKFDFVEIVKDFDERTGGGVAFLGRVKGFVSLFQQREQNGVLAFQIQPDEMYRFSHRIPSFKMTGEERKGVPKGSFEFDPAALPQSFFESCDHDSAKPESENPNTNGRVNESEGVDVESVKEDKKKHGNLTPKKQENRVDAKALEPRRSPRDLSKKNSEANGSPLAKQTRPEKVDHPRSSSEQFPKSPLSGKVSGSPFESFDFTQLTSEDKFKRGQIWALCTKGDIFPKTYGHIKKIESAPKFQVYLALLEPCLPPKESNRPVSCGTFKVSHEKAKPFPLSSFSHCLNASPVYDRELRIFPLKGEIWALYKNQNKSGCDIVEVLEDDDPGTKVIVLSRVSGFESVFRGPASQRSKSGVVDVPRSELGRFSHQIRAFQHTGASDSRLAGCWELDPKFTPGGVICID